MATQLLRGAPSGKVGGTSASRASRARRSLQVRATAWDPDGLFKGPPQTGLIDRKLMGQRVASDQEYKAQVATFITQQKEERQARRDARIPPEDPFDLIEYFLDTDAEDMEYEVARCRPLMTADFFGTLTKQAGIERVSPQPDEERLAELDGLREYLEKAVEAVDAATAAVSAAPARLKKLLESKDKKATLLAMAGDGEIDAALMDLIEQNIAGARAAGQDQAAEFMTKVQQAAARYLIKV